MLPDDGALNEAGEPSITGSEAAINTTHLPAKASSGRAAGRAPVPFTVVPLDYHLPPEWSSGCVEELIEMLEGPMHK